MKISELKQKRVALLAEARQILDQADKEKRSISGEESQEYERITGDLDSLEATIKVETDLAERQKSLAQATEERKEERKETSEYGKVFNKYLRRGMEDLSGEERTVLRVGYQKEERAGNMMESVPADGGYTVPVEFSNQLVNKLEEESGIRQAGATVLNTSSGAPILIPQVTAHSTPQGVVAEGVGPTADKDTFDQVPLGAFKYPALVKVSIELLQDSGVNLESYLASELGRKLGRAAGDAYAVGAGVSEPTGLVTAAADGFQTTVSSTAVDTDDFIELIYSVTAPYRRNAAFVMNDAIVAKLRKIKWEISGDSVGYAWQPSVQAGTPDRLFGYPIYIEPGMEDTLASNNYVALFGDISRFYIRQAGGVQFVRLNERFADDMMVGFLAWIRTDSNLTDANAVKRLKMKS